jgi:hypothetical protein
MSGEVFMVSLDDPPPNCHTCGKQWPAPWGGWTAAHWHATLKHSCECGAEYEFRGGRARQLKRGRKWGKKAKVTK